MKWIAALLMIFNVLIFLGISDRQVEYVVTQQELRPDVNGESMVLLHEINAEIGEASRLDSVLAQPDGIIPPLISPAEDLPTAVLGTAQPATVTIGTGSDGEVTISSGGESDSQVTALPTIGSAGGPLSLICYRVGPFKQKTSWRAAMAWVQFEGFEFNPIRSESRELRAVRVYIGPFDSIAAAQNDVEILKQKELDYFVYLRDDNEARISLGYFTQEELSIKFVDYLKSQNIEAKSQPEYRTLGPFDWMDLSVKAEDQQKLMQRNWDAKEVEITERDCDPL